MEYNLKKIKAFIFDLDGVFYKSDEILKGGEEIIRFLQAKDIPFAFYTNNSRKNPDEYVKKLANINIFVNENQIFTAGVLSKEYIELNYPNKKIKIYGSSSLKKLFIDSKIEKENPDIILIGMDNSINMKDLSQIRNFAQKEKQLIFTNPDSFIPTKNGFEFECGLIIDIMKKYCIKKPIIIGKPSSFGFELILDFLKVKKQNLAMVGDTYQTDIKGAIKVGIIPIHLNTSNKAYNKDILEALEFDDLETLLLELE